MAVPPVSIWPLLFPSRSPRNCLSIDILPSRSLPGSLSIGSGLSETSNGPLARGTADLLCFEGLSADATEIAAAPQSLSLSPPGSSPPAPSGFHRGGLAPAPPLPQPPPHQIPAPSPADSR